MPAAHIVLMMHIRIMACVIVLKIIINDTSLCRLCIF